ncbi:MAG: peptide chain release factor N(5)-glutamine methyltransferase [Treponema sp.]|uniref:peptide chain release factor N(5)-glutamine methyltransferase n=1 Tax=Treponema sp. TaxID=166 RepID=UPI003FA1F163
MPSVADARRFALDRFAQSAALKSHNRSLLLLDADVLLQHFLHKPRAWLFAHDTTDISDIWQLFCAAVEQRCTGLPIAYLTGTQEFWGLPFHVTPDVLIPKPDTELLVERSLAIIREKAAAATAPICILDPCTGSGCVIISILHSLEQAGIKNVYCTAADISPAALTIARTNAQNILSPEAQERLCIREGDMRTLPALQTRFDLIAANPPYVPSALTQELLQDGRSEPVLALDGGSDGLDFIRILTNNTPMVLHDCGVLLSEVGEYHAQAAGRLFETTGFSAVRIHQDWTNRDRLIEGVLHG